ncbi:hypothetical protein Dda_0937 [Drechslerella dactyloides]|uniref:Uncharacterized protein n=1 Tax=Drechslerella dactyloides TaxID=74499 RepID=A0AAD6J5S3_DREDA|nr:hypothetical protein Dda_0937 [Drechslerella dactyloides]
MMVDAALTLPMDRSGVSKGAGDRKRMDEYEMQLCCGAGQGRIRPASPACVFVSICRMDSVMGQNGGCKTVTSSDGQIL